MSRYTPELRREANLLAGELLPGWQITLVEERPEELDEDTAAGTSYSEHTFHVDLWLSDDTLAEADPRELRVTLVHELLHPLFRDLREEYMPDREEKPSGHARWTHLEELVVERIALAFGFPGWAGVK